MRAVARRQRESRWQLQAARAWVYHCARNQVQAQLVGERLQSAQRLVVDQPKQIAAFLHPAPDLAGFAGQQVNARSGDDQKSGCPYILRLRQVQSRDFETLAETRSCSPKHDLPGLVLALAVSAMDIHWRSEERASLTQPLVS